MTQSDNRSLVWFRRDLRIQDNRALAAAASTQSDRPLIGLFLITPEQWQQHDDAACKIAFMLECVRDLSQSLAKLNIPLLVKSCDQFEQVSELIQSLCQDHQVSHVYFNREYEINEHRRDLSVVECLDAADITVQRFHDRILVPPHRIKTQQEKFYSVYSPYRRVWDSMISEHDEEFAALQPAPKSQPSTGIEPSEIPDSIDGFDCSVEWSSSFPAGEAAAHQRLQTFAESVSDYHEQRDIPAVDGTSQLSPYLAAGVLSPRQCLAMAREAADESAPDKFDEGLRVWVGELTWRDFYVHVMVGAPRVSMHQPFKQATDQLAWRDDQDDFAAWCEGRTGFPIVDAGMRQLNQTGWMHNRLRMVTAMFLTKNLLIDWRLGERYFMQRLIDGDLASNNGGWQWSASTGTDSVPYFRIFNPFSQSKRFDKEALFIKRMCPELKPIKPSAIHDLDKLAEAIEQQKIDYPAFIVDYKKSRTRAIDSFKALND